MKLLNKLVILLFCCIISLNSVVFASISESNSIEIDKFKEPEMITLNIAGYSIKLPSDWKLETAKSRKSDEKIFNSNGIIIGAVKLIDKPIESYDTDIDAAFIKIVEQMSQDDLNAKHLEYLAFLESDNPSPYAYVIYFNTDYVDKNQIKLIKDSFEPPLKVKNPPNKNIAAMSFEEMQQNATYSINKVYKKYSSIGYNVNKLDRFIENQRSGIPDSLNIIKIYEDEAYNRMIKEWIYITYDGNKAYEYGYYQLENGKFTYDNPSKFDFISRKDYGNVIDYRISSDGELLNSLLQINKIEN